MKDENKKQSVQCIIACIFRKMNDSCRMSCGRTFSSISIIMNILNKCRTIDAVIYIYICGRNRFERFILMRLNIFQKSTVSVQQKKKNV